MEFVYMYLVCRFCVSNVPHIIHRKQFTTNQRNMVWFYSWEFIDFPLTCFTIFFSILAILFMHEQHVGYSIIYFKIFNALCALNPFIAIQWCLNAQLLFHYTGLGGCFKISWTSKTVLRYVIDEIVFIMITFSRFWWFLYDSSGDYNGVTVFWPNFWFAHK